MKQKLLFLTFIYTITACFSSYAAASNANDENANKLPRFVAFQANPARMRTGPDKRYPIKWIYKKEGVPVKVILEMNNWRKVKDWEGTEGWVSRSLLSNKRTFRVTGVTRNLRSMADERAPLVAYIEPGVFGTILKCPKNIDYCKVKVDKYTGWLPRNAFWGLLPNENIE
ncbi:MAG: hypothetical protein GY804_07930 [Alphaproteobacteria bacterium]|nr:hypothetical protein [Alphaproteobacteria bacterium]